VKDTAARLPSLIRGLGVGRTAQAVERADCAGATAAAGAAASPADGTVAAPEDGTAAPGQGEDAASDPRRPGHGR